MGFLKINAGPVRRTSCWPNVFFWLDASHEANVVNRVILLLLKYCLMFFMCFSSVVALSLPPDFLLLRCTVKIEGDTLRFQKFDGVNVATLVSSKVYEEGVMILDSKKERLRRIKQ